MNSILYGSLYQESSSKAKDTYKKSIPSFFFHLRETSYYKNLPGRVEVFSSMVPSHRRIEKAS
ncbi:MAG: hypothetical protein COZ29_00950 [Candidatus Moranbacteria bacterium CG_4_10_14_3_um_filter_45_9]|nr:MAG: hypothetical protein AUK19_03170 [Candidatus Moranbacteria bacterium CG2_30_45_14]PIX90253.1 MAG: hypothetical protein COZ29_00950 [Candidatus Moranbacteria bacterium CG_4_10_14_3_um_filter_45_9]PJA85992.1 MAG: hypothetical protein CO143_00215 [Candidatus Moranbacteria bacterium CG_4_9_14_3_um_filter_45_14]